MAGHRTPRSAILFGVVLLALIVAYVAIAFLYGNGWWTILSGVLGVVVIFLAFALLYAVARWWPRSGSPP